MTVVRINELLAAMEIGEGEASGWLGAALGDATGWPAGTVPWCAKRVDMSPATTRMPRIIAAAIATN